MDYAPPHAAFLYDSLYASMKLAGGGDVEGRARDGSAEGC